MFATVRIAVATIIVIFTSASQMSAQVLTNLYRFNGGTDGQNPMGVLLQDSSGNLYGTTTAGGDLSCVGIFSGMGCQRSLNSHRRHRLQRAGPKRRYTDSGEQSRATASIRLER
jgi:hypothetical protein